MMNKPEKPYWEMTTNELAEATREYDHPETTPADRPLSKAERDEVERARRGPHLSITIPDNNSPGTGGE